MKFPGKVSCFHVSCDFFTYVKPLVSEIAADTAKENRDFGNAHMEFRSELWANSPYE